MRKIFYVFLFLFLPLICVHAGIYQGEKMTFKQPDGTKVDVRVYGNEFYQDVESLDGYTLIRDEVTRKICYALLSSDGQEYASSGIVQTPVAVKRIVEPKIRISRTSVEKKIKKGMARYNAKKEGNVSLRTASVLPDTIYGIVLLVDFPDEKSSISREHRALL